MVEKVLIELQSLGVEKIRSRFADVTESASGLLFTETDIKNICSKKYLIDAWNFNEHKLRKFSIQKLNTNQARIFFCDT